MTYCVVTGLPVPGPRSRSAGPTIERARSLPGHWHVIRNAEHSFSLRAPLYMIPYSVKLVYSTATEMAGPQTHCQDEADNLNASVPTSEKAEYFMMRMSVGRHHPTMSMQLECWAWTRNQIDPLIWH